MFKRTLLSSLLILIVWVPFDLFLHNHYLAPLYSQNVDLWRPLSLMSVPLIFLVTLLLVASFVLTYVCLVRPRRLSTGVAFGALFGLALGVSVGFGTYIHSPIPLAVAWAWFIGAVLKALAAGIIVGSLIREPKPQP